jgi:hypothetical protein
VVLRVVLAERGRLRAWGRISQPFCSELLRLECLRTIDRARLRLRLGDDEVARRRSDLFEAIAAFNLVAVDRTVLERAAEPFPTVVGSLDAIHLASALLVRNQIDDLAFATHDQELGQAATATGFSVLS